MNLEDVEYGIAAANSVKNASQTIWAVGVGDQASGGITPTNLELVSGPGDFYTADFASLSQTLKNLANQLCGSRIHVRKLVGGVAADRLVLHRGRRGRGCDLQQQPRSSPQVPVARARSTSTTSRPAELPRQ